MARRRRGTTIGVSAILRRFPDADLVVDKNGIDPALSKMRKRARRWILQEWPVLTGFSKAAFQFNLFPKEQGKRFRKFEIRNTATYAGIVEDKRHIVERNVKRLRVKDVKFEFSKSGSEWREKASASERKIRQYVRSRDITIRRGA